MICYLDTSALVMLAVTLQARVKGRVVVACWDARLWDALRASDFDVVPKVRPSTG